MYIVEVHARSVGRGKIQIPLKSSKNSQLKTFGLGPADISGSQGLACEFAKDIQKREFLGLDTKFEFTTHFDFSFLLWASFDVRHLVTMPNKLRRKCFRG